MNRFSAAASLLPIALNGELLIMPESKRSKIEEIRLRAGQAMTVLENGMEIPVAPEHKVTQLELESVLECAAGASVHSVETSIANGYINVQGGIRLGICGTAILRSGSISGIRNLSSLSIRIPNERFGCASDELKVMLSNGLSDIIIISPPGAGKTTCLREYIRVISNMGYRVSIADERGEIAAITDGEPQFDIGLHSDVISQAPKAYAAMMLIKAMNPDIIAMDEISSEADMRAVYEASGCGVKLLSTAHAKSVDDLYSRKTYRKLMKMNVFKYALVIRKTAGTRKYEVRQLA